MELFWFVALLVTIPDLLTIADAVAERTFPGRHAAVLRTGHAALRVR